MGFFRPWGLGRCFDEGGNATSGRIGLQPESATTQVSTNQCAISIGRAPLVMQMAATEAQSRHSEAGQASCAASLQLPATRAGRRMKAANILHHCFKNPLVQTNRGQIFVHRKIAHATFARLPAGPQEQRVTAMSHEL